ncbi:anthranilate synthase component II [Nanoarchaeota archaeon]
MNILFIDNFDSFVYNLVDEFEKKGCNVLVYRNNTEMKVLEKVIKDFKPKLIVISPGPSNPANAGNCIQLIKNYYQSIPIMGICLGHQCLVEALGGKVDRIHEIVHGKSSFIKHDGKTIFAGIPNNFKAARYHSLGAVDVPYCFEVSARSESNVVMAIRHKEFPCEGVQFHPESVLTPIGGKIIDNMIRRK